MARTKQTKRAVKFNEPKTLTEKSLLIAAQSGFLTEVIECLEAKVNIECKNEVSRLIILNLNKCYLN